MRVTVDTPASPEILEALLEGLTAASCELMALRPLPPLYGGSIRYRRERVVGGRRRERWQLAPTTAALGYGDCEDLATYRAAELRARGIPARARVYRVSPRTLHVIVETPNGYEDPSRILGM